MIPFRRPVIVSPVPEPVKPSRLTAVAALVRLLALFQLGAKLAVDGICGPLTLSALDKAVDALDDRKDEGREVIISGGNCYIRTSANTEGKALVVAHRGEVLPFAGQVSEGGWLLVMYNGVQAWVSGKYGKLQ